MISKRLLARPKLAYALSLHPSPKVAVKEVIKKRLQSSIQGIISTSETTPPPRLQSALSLRTESTSQPRRAATSEEVVDVLPYGVDDDRYVARHSHMKYELRDTLDLGGLPVKSSKTENVPRKCATVGTVQIPQARKQNEETTVSAANQP
ncbi:hypothetical protein ACFX2I_003052 [Malus domestica]